MSEEHQKRMMLDIAKDNHTYHHDCKYPLCEAVDKGKPVAALPYGFDEFAKYIPKPVAAQEPIAWMHGTAGRFEVIHAEVKKLWERVGQPAQFAKEVVSCKVENYTIPLYSHAAQCARCELNESIGAGNTMLIESLQAKITEQAAELARINRLALCCSVDSWMTLGDDDKRKWFAVTLSVDHQKAERIKALEAFVQKLEYANTEAGNDSIALRRKLVAAESKIAKADAVILHLKETCNAGLLTQGGDFVSMSIWRVKESLDTIAEYLQGGE